MWFKVWNRKPTRLCKAYIKLQLSIATLFTVEQCPAVIGQCPADRQIAFIQWPCRTGTMVLVIRAVVATILASPIRQTQWWVLNSNHSNNHQAICCITNNSSIRQPCSSSIHRLNNNNNPSSRHPPSTTINTVLCRPVAIILTTRTICWAAASADAVCYTNRFIHTIIICIITTICSRCTAASQWPPGAVVATRMAATLCRWTRVSDKLWMRRIEETMRVVTRYYILKFTYLDLHV